VFHPVADATLSTVTLERLGNSSNNNNQRPARSLNSSSSLGGAAPTKYQLKTPFAVDG
jgi:hypothetical protein